MSRRKKKFRPSSIQSQNPQRDATPQLTDRIPERPSIGQLVQQRISKLNVTEPKEPVFPGSIPVKAIQPPPQNIPTTNLTTQSIVGLRDPWPAHWPKCPDNYNALEWQEALENKDYYEAQQRKDGNRKPWFQYPRKPLQYSEFVYLTPEMMEAAISHMPFNRDEIKNWSDAVSRDFTNERWLQTHESIAFNTQGFYQDGQHRGFGIIKSGKAWPLYVTWNVPPEGIFACDSGEKRKINEKMKLLFPDLKISNKTAALCRAMMWGLDSRGMKYTETEITEFFTENKQAIAWVTDRLSGFRADIQAVIAKAVLWYGEETIEPFAIRLKNIQFTGEGDPAKTFYVWLQKAKQEGSRNKNYTGPVLFYKKTLAAIQAFILNKSAMRIHKREDDIFKWEIGWKVPANSPCQGKPFNEVPPVQEN